MDKWLDPETWVLIGIIIIAAVITRFLLIRLVNGVTKRALERAKQRQEGAQSRAERVLATVSMVRQTRYQQRTATTASLITNLINIGITVIALLTILAVLGVPLAPLLTSAGVGGVALAFGSQSLVKDFLSGIFMILEDQYGVGDQIDTGDIQGVVEDVGLRVTRVRDATGTVWYLRNGDLLKIGNLSQGWATATVDLPLTTGTDPKAAISVLTEVAKRVSEDARFRDALLDVPTVTGLNQVTSSSLTFRITARTTPGHQTEIEAALREASLEALTQAGLEPSS